MDRLPGWAQKGTLVFPFFFLFVFIYKTITMSKIVITQEQLENLKKTLSENQGIVKEDKDKVGQCGCGRSPTGKCIGWHGLTEEAFREKLQEYKLNEGK